ncbi:MAG: efflux RND transporter permease subunit [Bacteroidales bacterium]|nr:efflux RND transporter permease subunit [Bacteroidales bacterium]
MSIFTTAVEKPISTLMVFVAIIVVGVYSYITLPIDQYPKMDPPYITVMATYPGANATDIEQNVTKQLEDQLNSVDDLKELSSESYDNLSVVTLEFEWGIDLDNASNDVRDAVDKAMNNLPDDMDRPTIMRISTSMMPTLVYAVTAKQSYSGLYKILDDKVIMSLNRVDGVASAYASGIAERVVYVDLDPNKLDAYNLTLSQIGNAILAENKDVSSGNVKVGIEDYSLRVEGEFEESDEIKDISISLGNDKTVKLSDIALVRDTLKDITMETQVNREDGCILLVTKQSDANAVAVAAEARAEIEKAQATLPSDIKFEMISDNSDFIIKAINNLKETLFYALLFVVIVVFVFLGRWRSTFVIALTIPISLIVAFIYLAVSDGSLNTITLMSLSIAIGMVVDDAIVVLENVTKHVDRGSRPKEAAKYGTNEVWTSVIVTTLVTIAVFFPLTMIPGIMGIFFEPLGWIICICVTTSTLTAISLTPMLCSKFLKLRDKEEDSKSKRFSFYNWSQKWLVKLDAFYERLIRWVLCHKTITVASMIALFIGSIFLTPFLHTEFFPQNDQNSLSVYAKMQQGQRVEVTKDIAMKVDSAIRSRIPEVRIMTVSYGSEEEASFASMMNETGNNIFNMRIRTVDLKDRTRSVFVIGDDVRKILNEFPEILDYEVEFGQSGATGNTVDIEVFGHDFDGTGRVAQELKAKLKNVPGAEDVLISRGDDQTELQLHLDREKLARHGLTTAGVGSLLRYYVYGFRQSKFKDAGDEYDIIVRLEEKYRSKIADIENMLITDAYGQKVRLKELGKLTEGYAPPSIERKSKQRMLKVSITPAAGFAMGDIANAAKDVISTMEIPSEYTLYIGGAYEDQQESFGALAMLVVLSLLLVYLVMAAEFESFIEPAIIMLAIPFAFTGVVLALLICNVNLSVVAALGAMMLIGIVTKNGIVLIDYINLMRERGIELYEAVALSCRSRLRPVLMTSFTTMLGMLPMALSTSEGSETWQPMGVAVIGGMIFSTIITMLIVPAVYAAVNKSGNRNKTAAERKQYKFMSDFDPERDLPASTRARLEKKN